MVNSYYALAKRDAPTGQYEIEFPDLPGCVSVADSFQDVLPAATEALAAWMETAVARDRPIPEPTDIHAYYLRKRNAGIILISVQAPPLKVKAVPVTISLNERVLGKIDAAATEAGLTRSAFIAQAALAAAAPPRPVAAKKRKAA